MATPKVKTKRPEALVSSSAAPPGVTAIARLAVKLVVPDPAVFRIHCWLQVSMASHTGEYLEVRRYGVAIATCRPPPWTVLAAGTDRKQWIMIVGGWLPRNGAMTWFTICGEPRCQMSGVCGLLEIGLVAVITDCRRARVTVVHVALDTCYRHMSAG